MKCVFSEQAANCFFIWDLRMELGIQQLLTHVHKKSYFTFSKKVQAMTLLVILCPVTPNILKSFTANHH